MRLMVGVEAPEITGETWDGASVRLSALRGEKVWLTFFRYATCPLCNLRVHELIKRYSGFAEKGLRVLAVFQSPPESIAEHVGKQGPPFPLICDPSEELYAQYGVEQSVAGFLSPGNLGGLIKARKKGFKVGRMEGTKSRLPAEFLIDEKGVIQNAFYARRIGEHLPFERVDQFIG